MKDADETLKAEIKAETGLYNAISVVGPGSGLHRGDRKRRGRARSHCGLDMNGEDPHG